MNSPIEVKVDLEANASYVRYRRLLPGEHVASSVEVDGDGAVVADVDADGGLIGIEVLGFDSETLDAAQSYARERLVRFPRNLVGVTPTDELTRASSPS